MLFREDLYALTWEAKKGTVRVSEIKDVVEMSLELAAGEDWANALDLMKDYVVKSLADESLASVQQTLLALGALCKSRLAVTESRWSLAADWLLTAMARCQPENDPQLEDMQPLAHQYLLICAAMTSDKRVLSYEPSQLHVQLSEEAFHNLALAYIRLSSLGKVRLDEALCGVVTLRNRIKEHLWQKFELGNKRRQSETDIIELAYQQSAALFNSVWQESQQILQVSSTSGLRTPATKLIQTLAQGKKLLFTDEVAVTDSLRELLGRELTPLTQAHESNNPVEMRDRYQQFASRATSVIEQLERGGLLAKIACLPPVNHVCKLAVQEAGFVESTFRPLVVLKQTTKRYPIDHVDEMILLQVEIVNEGRGLANTCQVQFNVPEGGNLTFTKSMPLMLEPLPPSRFTSLECPVRLNTTFDTISLPVNIAYTDVFGNSFSSEERLILERQREEPDWDELMNSAPYKLKALSSLEQLRGRTAILNTLKVNVAIGTSTVLWGLKRVGKTSIAQVFEREVIDRNRYLPIYVRRGEVSGYSEGQMAKKLASKIASAIPHLRLDVPDEDWFGPHFTRITDWLDSSIRCGLSQKLVIIIDEFDEINSAIYLGKRGENFFATLRSLMEKDVVWIFVGGERMPNIFLRHHTTLNNVQVHKVDRISDPRDIVDIIVSPVQGKLDWEPEAIDLVRQFSAGNPYFIQLLCQRVITDMLTSKRTFVDRADVNLAARAIVVENTPNHWGHFWEDNSEIEPDLHYKQSARSALFLAALGVASRDIDSSPVSLSSITEAIESLDADKKEDFKLSDIASDLVRRGVLQEVSAPNETHYQTVVPLFGEFLGQHSRSVVYPYYKHYRTSLQQPPQFISSIANISSIVESFPIDEGELIELSEGLIYQGKKVDPAYIKVWLRQFPDEGAILVATKILNRLKERYYFDLPRVRHAIDYAYDWLQQKMKTLGQTLIVAGPGGKQVKEGGRIVNVYVTYYGLTLKSGADIAREFKTQKRFSRSGAIENALDWVIKDRAVEKERKFILIVDDFVGTGGQAKTELLDVANKLRKNSELMKWAKTGRILFTPLWAFADGVDAIKNEVGDVICIQPSRNLDDEDRAFSPTSDLYDNEDERRYAEAVFRHIGEQLQPQHPLGHNDCQALVVFESTVPNNTLPVFWCSGIVDEKPWKPLFQRP